MTLLRYKFLFLALLLCAQTAFAQEQPPKKNVPKPPADTTRPVPQDTTQAAKTFADSVKPIPQLARPYAGPAHGFSDGVWEWDRNALLGEAPLTLADLLERVPGALVVRTGLYLQPLPGTAMGGTGNRVEVWLNGYALDPLLEGSFDLTRLELAEIDNVRIERRMSTIRIYIETIGARDNRPYSMVEAAVGQPNANLFRGIFLAPKIVFGPAGVAIDRTDTRGLHGAESATQTAGWAKWSFIRKGSGLEVEYRRATSNRDLQVPWPEEYTRTDVVVRGRAQLLSGLVAEAFAGQSRADLDTTSTGVDSIARVKEDNRQFGGRISLDTPFFWANGRVRFRDAKALAASEFGGAAGVHYSVLSAAAEITQTDWRTSGTASELTLRAELGPFAGLRVFGETTSSDRGVAYLNRLPDSAAIITPFTGYRAGADFAFHGITLGGALLHAKSDSVTTFGLPFDTSRATFAGSDATGVELTGRIPLPFLKAFALEGTITDWHSGTVGLYMPTRTYRAGMELHALPLKSGNLELIGRIESIHRGLMYIFNRGATTPEEAVVALPASDYVDAYAQIRIMDVRAFVRYEDLLGKQLVLPPGDRILGGPRIFYGVKWQFYN